jgi:hypothetical protein
MSHVSSTGEAVRWVSFGADQRRLGAFHASEIAYVFNNPNLQLLNSATPKPADIALADTMSDYWVNFARTSNPNGSDRPVWSPYTDKSRHYMGFANGAVPAVKLLPGSLELHRQIDERRAKRLIPWDGGQAGLLGRTQPILAASH